MAPNWLLIRDLDDSKQDSLMKLRLVCFYETLAFKSRDVYSLDCIFHDSEEDRVQVTFPRSIIQAFKPLLIEGQLYGLKKFRLSRNTGKYRVITAKFRIQVGEETQLRVVFDSAFPTKRFWLKPVLDVLRITDDGEEATFDVIGVLVEVSLPQDQKTYRGDVKKMMNIYLEDMELNRLCCTLWDEYIELFMSQLDEQTVNPKIVIVQHCKANIFNEKTKVANVLHATKIYINGDFEKVNDFRMRYVDKYGQAGATCSGVSQGTHVSSSDHYVEGVTVKTKIIDLFFQDEVAHCWIAGSIDSIDFDGGWHYVACSKCLKKLDKMDRKFYCRICNSHDVCPTLRYKLKISVRDDTGLVTLLLWDNDAYHIIGKTAAEIKDSIVEGGVADPEGEIALSLLCKHLIFKIKMRSDHVAVIGGGYSVSKVYLSAQPVPSVLESQESNCPSKEQPVDNTVSNTPSSKEELPRVELSCDGSGVLNFAAANRMGRSLDGAFEDVQDVSLNLSLKDGCRAINLDDDCIEEEDLLSEGAPLKNVLDKFPSSSTVKRRRTASKKG